MISQYIVHFLRILNIIILMLLLPLVLLKLILTLLNPLVTSIYINSLLIKLLTLILLLLRSTYKLWLLCYENRRIPWRLKSHIICEEVVLVLLLNVLINIPLLSHLLYLLNDILKNLKKTITSSVFKVQRNIADSRD